MSANAREIDTKVEDSRRRNHHHHHHNHHQHREEEQQEHASSNTSSNSNDDYTNRNEMELYSPNSTHGELNTAENGQSKHARTVENKQQQQEQNVEANAIHSVTAHSLSQQHKNNNTTINVDNSDGHENNTKGRELMTEDNNKERANQSTEEVRNLVQNLTKKKKKVKKPTERELLPRVHASNKTTTTVNEDTINTKETDNATSDTIATTVPEVAYIPQRSAEQGSFNDGMDILQQLMRPMRNEEEVPTATNISEPHEGSESESKRKRRSKKNKTKQKDAITPSHSLERPGDAATNINANNNNKHVRVKKELVPETLIPLSVNKTRPVESYFVDFAETPVNLRGAGLYNGPAVSGTGSAAAVTSPAVISFAAQQEQEEQAIQPLNEEEMLLEQFAEYTDDDSFFSSSEQVIPVNARRHVHDPLRQRATRTVHETLELQEFNVRKGHYVGQTQANMTDAYYGTGQLQYVDEL